MRIGVNLLYVIPGVVGGTESYAKATISELARRGTHDIVLFVNRNLSSHKAWFPPGVELITLDVDAHNRRRRYWVEQTVLPGVARKAGVDLLHSMGYVAPLVCDVPSVVTIHDVNFKHMKMPGVKGAILPWFVRESARRCDAIVTVSEFSKAEITSEFNVGTDKTTVTYNAPSEDVFGDGEVELKPYPYILTLSSLSPHKNMERLMQSFQYLLARRPDLRLIIAGHLPPGLSVPAAVEHRVTVTGFIPREQLLGLYRGAGVFVMPSLYEGFGIPLIEAMAMGIPSASSDRGSLPEIGRDAAVYFNPLDLEDMAASLTRILEDTSLRNRLSVAGRIRAKDFTWGKSVDCLETVYRRVATKS